MLPVRLINSANVLVARSNSLQLKLNLLKKALIVSAFFYVSIFNALAGNCPPQHIDESVRVNYVYDGDTLQLEDGRKIRLLGIDTPEVFSKHNVISEDIKLGGERAKAELQKQLSLVNNRVSLAYGPQRFDRYKRTLAHVFLPDGKNMQAWLIAHGHAIAFTTPPNDRMSDCYKKQEKQAIDLGLGIWELPQYQLKQASQLNKSSRGFHRLQAKVTRVWQSNHSITLFLDDRVEVKIYKNDLMNFNAHMLNNLEFKKVLIRGWLHVKKSDTQHKNKISFIMTLRHPDAIKVVH
ncbi:MAG: hypothetical protein DIZ80_09510 [endosymbiont of Galathealinum brachiosum]|uniref:TNase-like domain-containing protein n=1 Tax=endosymbiont of Galathealinum brachiosum TaxID=2200906 RepID=A0A370DCA7_9GAMM|nr:MAG: hypothetical protein DIZ80_09510 [endosymbiont of Galathealinum brachiosum]